MNKKRLVFAFLAVDLIVIILFAGYIAKPIYSDYCAEQKRYLSDDEFIQIALLRESHTLYMEGMGPAVHEFYAKHPSCCHVDRKFSYSSVFEKLVSYYVVDVKVFYEINPNVRDRYQSGKYYESHHLIGACGKVYRTYGMDTDFSQ